MEPLAIVTITATAAAATTTTTTTTLLLLLFSTRSFPYRTMNYGKYFLGMCMKIDVLDSRP